MESAKPYSTTIKLSLLAGLDWIILAVILAVVNQVQLMTSIPGPDTLFGYGVLRPIFTTALIFGAGLSFFIGAGFYLIQKLEDVKIVFEPAGFAALLLVNLGVLLGILTILLGYNKGREFGEMTFLSDTLVVLGLIHFLAVVLVSLSGKDNPKPGTYFTLAAAAGGTIVYILGNLGQPYGPLFTVPINAGIQDLATGEYYRTGLLGFLIIMPALAMAYYFVPTKFEVDLVSTTAPRAQVAALTILAPLAGAAGLVHTPVAGLHQTIGVILGIAFSFAVIIGGVTLFQTMWKSSGPPRMDGERRFLRWGIYFLLFFAWYRVLTGFRGGQEIFGFTWLSPLDIAQDALLYGGMIALGAAFIISRDYAGESEAGSPSNRMQAFYLTGGLLILTADFSHSLIQSSALRELTGDGTPAVTLWTGVVFAGTAFDVKSPELMYLVSFRGLALLGYVSILIGLLLGAPKLYMRLLSGLDFKALIPALPELPATEGAGGKGKDYMLVEEERNT